jgi:hypothetical protein
MGYLYFFLSFLFFSFLFFMLFSIHFFSHAWIFSFFLFLSIAHTLLFGIWKFRVRETHDKMDGVIIWWMERAYCA